MKMTVAPGLRMKRWLAMVLAITLILGVFPATVSAEETEAVNVATADFTTNPATSSHIFHINGAAWPSNEVNRIFTQGLGGSNCYKFQLYYNHTAYPDGAFVSMKLSEQFLANCTGNVRLEVEYYDTTETAAFQVASWNGEEKPVRGGSVTPGGTNTWKTWVTDVYGIDTKRTGDNVDNLRIYPVNAGTTYVYIKSIKVTNLPALPVADENEAIVDFGYSPVYGANVANSNATVWQSLYNGRLVSTDVNGDPCSILQKGPSPSTGNPIPAYFPIRLNDEFFGGDTENLRITVEYYDVGTGFVQLAHTKLNDSETASVAFSDNLTMTGTGELLTWTKDLTDVSKEITADNFHIRLGTWSSTKGDCAEPIYLKRITITKLPSEAAPDEATAYFNYDSAIYSNVTCSASAVFKSGETPSGQACYVMGLQPVSTNPCNVGLTLSDTFLNTLTTGKVEVTVEYYDVGTTGFFQVQYATPNGDASKLAYADTVSMTGTNELKTLTTTISNVSEVPFEGYHVKLSTWTNTGKGISPTEIYIKSVKIKAVPAAEPVDEANADFSQNPAVCDNLSFDKTSSSVFVPATTTNGESCYQLPMWQSPTTGNNISSNAGFVLSDEFLENFAAYGTSKLEVTVEYYDEGNGWFQIGYSAPNGDTTKLSYGSTVTMTDTGELKTFTQEITNVSASTFEGQHVRLNTYSTNKGIATDTVYIKSITIKNVKPEELVRNASISVNENGEVVADNVTVTYSEGKKNDDGTWTLTGITNLNGTYCWQSESGTAAEAPTYILFTLSEGFVKLPNDVVKVDIEYYDGDTGFVQICYANNVNNAPVESTTPTLAGEIRTTNTKEWKTATLYISDMTQTGVNVSYHLRLATYGWYSRGPSANPMYIKSVTFSKPGTPDVETALDMTGMPEGLIFTNSTVPQVPVKFTNNTDAAQTVTVSAVLRNHNGAQLASFTDTVQLEAKGSGTFNPNLSAAAAYGTYSLEMTAKNGDEVIKTATYRFSRVRSVDNKLDLLGYCDHTLMGTSDYTKLLPIGAKMGAAYAREDFSWAMIEKTKGSYALPEDWGQMINTAKENGLTVLPILGGTNDLYNGTASHMRPMDEDWQKAFADYCVWIIKELNTRYGLTEFELWNEWNAGHGSVPNTDTVNYTGASYYAPVLFEAAKAIKSDATLKDKNITILTGGMSGGSRNGSYEWLEAVLNYTEGEEKLYDYIDGIAYHPYDYPKDPSNGYQTLTLDMMIKLFEGRDPKQIWITEVGWPNGATGISSETYGAFAIRMYTDFLQSKYTPYLKHVFLYNLQNKGTSPSNNEHNFGLIYAKGISEDMVTWFQDDVVDTPLAAKDNYVALSAMTSMLNNATHVNKLTMGDGITVHQFTKGDKDLIVAWAKTGTVEMISLSATSAVTLTDMYGNDTTLTPVNGKVNLSISNLPVYLTMEGFNAETAGQGAFELEKTTYVTAPGGGFTVNVTRQLGYETYTGEYQLVLPAGWSATGTAFSANASSDSFRISVPANCAKGRYTITVNPTSAGEVLGSFNIYVDVTGTFLVNPAYVDGKYLLEVTVQNAEGTEDVSGTVTLNTPTAWITDGEATKNFTAPAGQDTTIHFAVPEGLSDSELFSVQVTAQITGKDAVTIDKKVSFQRAVKATGTMTMDGNLTDAEWAGASLFTMGEAQWTGGNSEAHTGTTVTGYTKWDEDYLYVAFEVNESVHHMAKTYADIWNGDGIQLGIDPDRYYEAATGSKYNEIGVAKNTSDNEVYTYKWVTTGADDLNNPLQGGNYAVVHDNGKTVYELAFPWDVVAPKVDITNRKNIGFSVVVNEDTGTGRVGWLTYMDGIASGKNASLFGDLILADAPADEPDPIAGTVTNYSHTISLEGNIFINKYVNITGFEEITISEDNSGLLIWTSEITPQNAVFGEANAIVKAGLKHVEGSKYGQSTDGIAPKNYGDKLYMRAYVKVGDEYFYSDLKGFSVADYCNAIIGGEYTEAEKKLCAAVLQYGAEAQVYFDYNASNRIDANLSADYKTAYDATMQVTLNNSFTTSLATTPDAFTKTSKSISLDEGITINYYYTLADASNITKAELLTWSSATEELTYDNAQKTNLECLADGRYAARGALVAAPDWSNTIYACARIETSDGKVYISNINPYSANAYASYFANQSVKETNVMQAMLVYGHLAQVYFANR